jgi:para-aminobenzoate synthetase
LCLTNKLEAEVSDPLLSTFQLYKTLRKRNPAPYSAYIRWNMKNHRADDDDGDDSSSSSSLAICCSSPERFMSIQRRQPHPEIPMVLQAEAKPIKGTCARVLPQNCIFWTEAESREDERRARSLELSLKDRAENLMIVDLLRNDMSRVCQVGLVHVAKLMAIESFATVHQMVSTIRGTLPDEATSIDLLRASFPGGSMTGAPKIRTMELLEELEKNVARGPYAGSLGYLSVNGCMDMNIIIRSAVVTPTETGGQKISIGAGGAITALSDTQDEYDEMLLKARAVVQSVQEWASRNENLQLIDSSKKEEVFK